MSDRRALQMIERRIMEAEYLLDSTTAHVKRSGCADMKPRTLKRMYRALNAVRGARDRVRALQGSTQWTLFANSNNPEKSRQKQRKTWKHSQSHGWTRDCVEEAERGLLKADRTDDWGSRPGEEDLVPSNQPMSVLRKRLKRKP